MAYGTIKVDNITFDNGGVDKLITVSGLFYSTSGALTVTGTISGGNVVAPTATFTTLTGTTTAGTTATFTSGSFTSLTGVTATISSGIFAAGSATAPSVAVGTGTTYKPGIYSPGTDQLAISTAGVGQLFVDASGKVGIGTTPNYNLHTTETVAVTSAASYSTFLGQGTRADLVLKATSSNNDQQRQVVRSNSDSLIFGTENAAVSVFTEKLRIDSSGRVGIGTTSPTSSFHVGAGLASTQSPVTYLSAENGSVAVACEIRQGRFDKDVLVLSTNQSLSANLFNAIENGTSRFVITGAGNVGIGTTSPVALLDVRSATTWIGDGATDAFLQFNQSATAANRWHIGTGSSNALIFYKGTYGSGSETARIDSSGRLLVGTSSVTAVTDGNINPRFEVEGTDGSTGAIAIIRNSADANGAGLVIAKSRGAVAGSNTSVISADTIGEIRFEGADGTQKRIAASIGAAVDGTPGANDMPGRLVFSTTADGAASPTERMRIGSNGEMLLGSSQISTGRTLSVTNIGLWNGGSNTAIGWFAGSAPTAALKFDAWWDISTDRLNITDSDYSNGVILSQNSNSWGAFSDRRLKKDICPIENSIALLKEIKPCRFTWKLGSQSDIGFIAQELKPVLPEAVDGDESDFRQEGDRFYGQMAVKHDKLIPVLTAALQEAIAKIEALETRLSALESA